MQKPRDVERNGAVNEWIDGCSQRFKSLTVLVLPIVLIKVVDDDFSQSSDQCEQYGSHHIRKGHTHGFLPRLWLLGSYTQINLAC